MIPSNFGDVAARLHPADSKVPCSGLGVVVVPPHGLEALAAAKSLRLLAERLSAQGHAVLRFDLPGTGDSLDSQGDPVACWIGAVAAAAEHLREAAGVDGIVVVGLRLGALLAAAAAPRVTNLAGLVLLDPVTAGRSYARELAMTAKVVAEGARLDPDATSTAEGVLVGGLLTTRAALEGLRGLGLAGLDVAVPTLCLHRNGARDVATIVAGWNRVDARAEPAAGFEGIGLSPTMAVTPQAAFARAAEWIGALPRRPSRQRGVVPMTQLAGEGFVEESLIFGPGDRLFGVLCRPIRAAAGDPALIIVNAGRNPQTGWARSGVTLARRLAAEGVATLRFDLGGIGEGIDRPGAADHVDELLYADDQDAELTAAIDLMADRDYGALTLLGACSGAYLALRGGARDPRVDGVVLVNLQRFVWRAGETVSWAIANHYPVASSYAGKVVEARAWKRVLSGERRLGPLLKVMLTRAVRRVTSLVGGAAPETVAARALVRAMVERNAGINFIYSEDDPGVLELAHHFGPRGRGLAARPTVKFHFVPDTDHDLTPAFARELLFDITRRAVVSARGGTASRG